MRPELDQCAPERIIIVLPTWVGDAVMATPTMREIRRQFPKTHIAHLVEANTRPVIDSSGWMDEVICWPPRKQGGRRRGMVRLATQIRQRRFDWAVLLPNSFRSAFLVRLAGVPRRIGYDRDGRRLLLTDRLRVQSEGGRIAVVPMVEYYGRIAEALGCATPGHRLELATEPESEEFVARRLGDLGIADQRPLVVMNPGAKYGSAKQWLPERFAAVGDRLIAERGAAVVITCGPGEEDLAHSVAVHMRQRSYVLDNPRGTLSQLKSLIRRCDLLLTNDTGPRHFAKAFGLPVVTVFGSTVQKLTDTDYALERKVHVEVDCGPCALRVCPLDHRCMTGVSVDAVCAACGELLSTAAQLG
ncbi:MAG: lipopolysaccharide heptosyltransferase II [bacterium]|nr:lipopolysaccharide heptosyltransferase II [bacterium]